MFVGTVVVGRKYRSWVWFAGGTGGKFKTFKN